jgi:hypothetical protein
MNNEEGALRHDPTILTTAQLMREITHLRELQEARFEAMDKAVNLLQEFANRQPTIAEVVAKNDEKFLGMDALIAERDRRFDLRDRDRQTALDAALATAKEAVQQQQTANAQAIQKSEAAFTKQIDQIGNIINSQATTLDDKINDIRTRLATVETHFSSSGKGITDYFGIIMGVVAIAALIGTLVGYALFKTSPTAIAAFETRPAAITTTTTTPDEAKAPSEQPKRR